MTHPSPVRPSTLRDAALLRGVAEKVLEAAGCPPEMARVSADVFVEADLRGIGLQGLDYLPLMVKSLQSGRIRTDVVPTVEQESDAAILLDGHSGVGQHAAIVAVDMAMAKARLHGACVAGLVDASEIYMLGYYVERIAREGLIGIAFTTWAPLVHPWGSMEAILGTNPLAIAFPTAEEDPVVIDMATSALANGRVRQAAYHDEHVAEGVGLGPDGRPTTVATEIQKGAISPFAGAKGFGLSLAVAMLCGPLIGADIGKALKSLKSGGPSDAKLGHFFVAIDPRRLLGNESFPARASAFLDEIRSSRPAPGTDGPRIPGSRAFQQRKASLESGVDVLDATWAIVTGLAKELDVEIPG